MAEQDHLETVKSLEIQCELDQKFEQVGEISKCKECGKEKFKHILTCPAELKSTQEKKCFKCQRDFKLRYVFAKKDYSLKNNWDYWTEEKRNQGKYICNSCLLDLYYNDKKQYLQEVQKKKKRQIFKVYVYNKTIS